LAGVTLIATLGVLVGILAAVLTTPLVGSPASVLVAGLAAFTGNLALPRFVHPRKAAVGVVSLVRPILFFSHVVFPQFCWKASDPTRSVESPSAVSASGCLRR